VRGEHASTLAAIVALLAGCATNEAPPYGHPTGTERPTVDNSVREGDEKDFELAAAEFSPLIAGQIERAGRLATFESRAALELRYRDDSGDHFEQCDADIFLSTGGRGALRLVKLGSNLMWIGGDGARAWIFRLDGSPTTVTIYEGLAGGVQVDAGEVVGTGEFTLLSPESVRVLMGIAPLPTESFLARIPGVAVGAPIRERFEVRWTMAKGVLAAMRFGADGLPSAVFLRGKDETEIARTTLSEPVRAPAENIAQGAWPMVARRIEMVATRSGSNVRIYLDGPLSQAKRMKPKFFVLDEILAQLRPDSVVHVTVTQEAASQ